MRELTSRKRRATGSAEGQKAGGQRGVSRCGAAMEDDAPVIYGLEFQVGAGGDGRRASRWRCYLREGGGYGAGGVCGGAGECWGPLVGRPASLAPRSVPVAPVGFGGSWHLPVALGF